jgi:hypothetical protein
MRRCLACLLLATVVAGGIRAWIGCPPIGYALTDSILALISPARLAQGQVPVRDFPGSVWLSSSLVGLAGVGACGCRGLAITAGYLLVAPGVMVLAWHVAKVRLPAFFAGVWTFALGLMTVAVNAPGGLRGTYAMHYNRLGWVLFTLVALQCFMPPRATLSRRRHTLESLCTGAITAALLFLKLNYFAAATLTLAIAMAIFPHVRRGVLGLALGFSLATVAALAVLHFNAVGWFRDVVAACGVVGGGKLSTMVISTLRPNLPWIALVLVSLAIVLRPVVAEARRQRRPTENLAMALAAAILIPAGLLTMAMNHQDWSVPTLALAATSLWELLRRMHTSGPKRTGGLRYVVCLLVIFASFVPTLGLDLAALGVTAKQTIVDVPAAPAAARCKSAALADFVCLPRAGEPLTPDEVFHVIRNGNQGRPALTAYQCAVILNDGFDLLTGTGLKTGHPPAADSKNVDCTNSEPRDRIITLDALNPFPLAFGLPYISGELPFCQYGVSMDEKAYSPLSQILPQATLVMEPKCSLSQVTTDYFRRVYGPVLTAEFGKIGESRFWVLWRRTRPGNRP